MQRTFKKWLPAHVSARHAAVHGHLLAILVLDDAVEDAHKAVTRNDLPHHFLHISILVHSTVSSYCKENS